MSDILIGVIVFGLVFGAANILAMVFLDSQSTNYDSRNSSASLSTFNSLA